MPGGARGVAREATGHLDELVERTAPVNEQLRGDLADRGTGLLEGAQDAARGGVGHGCAQQADTAAPERAARLDRRPDRLLRP